MAAKHSLIGASSASRWFECPGSIRMTELAPPQEQNAYAAEGSAAHHLAEKCLVDGHDPDFYFGEKIKIGEMEFEVDQDMCDAVSMYLDVVGEDEGIYKVMIEQKLDLTRLHPDLYGTADAIKVGLRNKKLKVIDYKHGKGMPVFVENNKQAMYYALGAIEAIYQEGVKNNDPVIDDPLVFGWEQFEEIELIIVQPRARHADGPVRRWVVPKGRLNEFQDELLERAKLTADPNAPLKAGKHCRFCPALATCPAQLQLISDMASADFTPIVKAKAPALPAVEALSMDQLVGVLTYADQISAWLKSAEAYAFGLMSRGESIPGFKLVKKKANRKWANEEEARETLSLYLTDEQIQTAPELKSPAQIEKLLKKAERDLIKPLIVVPDTGCTIAEESDPREAIQGGSVMNDFTAIN